jgi:equilibrative nucleoside transporter 1/2/3
MLSLQNVFDLGEPYWTFLWDIPFAMTNGYIATLSMVSASNQDDLSESQRATAGFLMTFSINLGILIAMGLTFAMPVPTLPDPGQCPL